MSCDTETLAQLVANLMARIEELEEWRDKSEQEKEPCQVDAM